MSQILIPQSKGPGSTYGHLLTFNAVENNVSALAGLEKLPMKEFENYFAFEAEESIFFISTNFQRNVVKYNLKDNSHRIVRNSQIPDAPGHAPSLTNCNTYGFRVGYNFFVVKGLDKSGNYDQFTGSTWIWNIKKGKWFKGGLKLVGDGNVCYVPIGIVT